MANACDDEGSLFFFSKVILPSNFYGKLRAANNQRDTRQVPPYRLTTKNGLYGVSFIKKKKVCAVYMKDVVLCVWIQL